MDRAERQTFGSMPRRLEFDSSIPSLSLYSVMTSASFSLRGAKEIRSVKNEIKRREKYMKDTKRGGDDEKSASILLIFVLSKKKIKSLLGLVDLC